jgi:ClpP class serine protease
VDKIYEQFKTAMTAQRPVSDENFGNGRVFDGEDAAELGFTDGVIDSLEEILEELVD